MYEKRSVASEYGRLTDLFPPERAILTRFQSEIEGARILDLGVGTGRTTAYLLEISRDYIGADFARQMVERARRRFPGVRFEVLDARDMSCFPDESFDVVIFSYNGMDCLGHEDRLTILKEVRRILRTGGLFIFSSHHRNSDVRKAWSFKNLAVNPLRHPVRFGKKLGSYLIGIANYLGNIRETRVEDEYCILNDAAHRYSMLNYYIGIEAQMQQLRRNGYDHIDAVGIDGRWLPAEESRTNRDKSIYYVCRRGTGASSARGDREQS